MLLRQPTADTSKRSPNVSTTRAAARPRGQHSRRQNRPLRTTATKQSAMMV